MSRWTIRLSSIAVAVAAAIASTILILACGGSPTEPARANTPNVDMSPTGTFKVATWNIRSGMGIAGFSTTNWTSNTINCTDRSQPLNAWGMGLPQAELGKIRDDRSIVAFAVQEAWNCGSPSNVNSVLGFKDITGERNGTALAARHGFAAAPMYVNLGGEDWVVGGAVCLDAACSASVPVFSTHWTPPDGAFGAVAQRTIQVLSSQSAAHVLLGDLNVYRIDTWNPEVPCTGSNAAPRVEAIGRMEAAGYADAWKTTQSGEGWTGMATRNGCGVPNGNLFKRIDYVYSRNLRAVATTRLARAAAGADAPSDHVMLVAELARQ
jgi:hypothetical protein